MIPLQSFQERNAPNSAKPFLHTRNRVRTTWSWINYDRVFIFGWTIHYLENTNKNEWMCHNTGLLRVAVDQEVWGPAVIVMVSAGLCSFLEIKDSFCMHSGDQSNVRQPCCCIYGVISFRYTLWHADSSTLWPWDTYRLVLVINLNLGWW